MTTAVNGRVSTPRCRRRDVTAGAALSADSTVDNRRQSRGSALTHSHARPAGRRESIPTAHACGFRFFAASTTDDDGRDFIVALPPVSATLHQQAASSPPLLSLFLCFAPPRLLLSVNDVVSRRISRLI